MQEGPVSVSHHVFGVFVTQLVPLVCLPAMRKALF
jgi:hypothetical protein